MKFEKFKTALRLCIPFSCTIGGVGTLIGSGSNIYLKDLLEMSVVVVVEGGERVWSGRT